MAVTIVHDPKLERDESLSSGFEGVLAVDTDVLAVPVGVLLGIVGVLLVVDMPREILVLVDEATAGKPLPPLMGTEGPKSSHDPVGEVTDEIETLMTVSPE